MTRSRWSLVGLILTVAALAARCEDKKDLELSDVEKAILELTNEARVKEKLPPLKANPKLFQAARAHSANMAKQEKMEHELDGKGPSDRVDAAGYKWSRVGENVAMGDRVTIKTIFEGWMDSKPHRANLLNPEFTEIGLGAAKGEKGVTYYTQVFAAPAQ